MNGQSEDYSASIKAKQNGLKFCRKCKGVFPATTEFFAADCTSSCGLRSYCKECGNKQTAEYKDLHREEVRQISHRYYWQHRDVVLLAKNTYNANNRDKAKAQSRKRYWKDVEKSRTRSRLYYWRNVEILRSKAIIAQNKRRSAEGSFTPSDVREIFQSQKGLCWWCGKKLNGKYHIDHRIALSRGGTNWPNNLCITCPECNLSKNNKMPHEWIGRLL